jgi:hypothetical protein
MTYSVWVGGSEVNDYELSLAQAVVLAQDFIDADYDEVAIEKLEDNNG